VDLLDAAKQARADDDGGIVARVAVQSRKSEFAGRPAPDDEAQPSSGPFAIAIARLGMQLAEGLHAAHAEGIVHRDLKPSNVLLAWSGQPMLLDFNLSTDVAIENFRVGGTLAYMAPEQIEALQHDPFAAAANLDPRADIYSLGVLLFELLTGRLPAQPADADHLPLDAYQPWLECKSAAAPRLDNTCPIDPRLSSIVLKCLAPRSSDRYATAAALASDLANLLRPPPTELVSLPESKFAQPQVQRAAAALLLAAIVISALGLAFILPGLVNSPAANPHSSRPPQRVPIPQPNDPAVSIPSANELFRRCLTLLLQGDVKAAHVVALQLIELNRAAGMALAGWSSYEAGNPHLAYEEFSAATSSGCRRREFLIRTADTAASLREYGFAITIYDSLLKKDPKDIHALRGRIYAYIQLGTTKKSADLDAQALEDAANLELLQSESPDALWTAFQAYDYAARRRQERSPEAADCLQRLLERSSEGERLNKDVAERYSDVVAGISVGPEIPLPFNQFSPRLLRLPPNLRLEDFATALTAKN